VRWQTMGGGVTEVALLPDQEASTKRLGGGFSCLAARPTMFPGMIFLHFRAETIYSKSILIGFGP